MPTPAATAASIHKNGEPVVLRRVNIADRPLTAFVRGYRPDELVDDIAQGDREVTIAGPDLAAWPAPPVKGDQVMIDGRTTTVQSCETRKLRGEVDRYVVQVRG